MKTSHSPRLPDAVSLLRERELHGTDLDQLAPSVRWPTDPQECQHGTVWLRHLQSPLTVKRAGWIILPNSDLEYLWLSYQGISSITCVPKQTDKVKGQTVLEDCIKMRLDPHVTQSPHSEHLCMNDNHSQRILHCLEIWRSQYNKCELLQSVCVMWIKPCLQFKYNMPHCSICVARLKIAARTFLGVSWDTWPNFKAVFRRSSFKSAELNLSQQRNLTVCDAVMTCTHAI